MLASLLLAAVLPVLQQAPAPQPFDIQLIPVRADPALDAWHRVPARFTPQFAPVTRMHPGERVLLLVPMVGLTADARGESHVTLDVEQRRADGTVGGLGSGLVAWEGRPPAPGVAVLSRSLPGLAFGPDEPVGPVLLSVRATDGASGATVERTAALELVAWSYGDLPADREGYVQFSRRYHRVPEPGQAVRAFLEFGQLERPDGTLDMAAAGFFSALLRDQAWLADHLLVAARGDPARRKQATLLLHLAGLPERIPELHPDDPQRGASARAAISGLRLPDPYGALESGAQLDLLWGEFFASARWRPVRQVVAALRHLPAAAAAPDGQDPAAALRDEAARAAARSLEESIFAYPLVAQYVLGMLEDERELDPPLRALLAQVFDHAAERRRAVGHAPEPEGAAGR